MSESTVPNDVCEFKDANGVVCGLPYDITPENARLFNFLEYPDANHVEAYCPKKHMENIFVTPEGFMQVLKLCKLVVVFGLRPSDTFKEQVDRALGRLKEPTDDPPHWILKELYDQMRDYEGSN